MNPRDRLYCQRALIAFAEYVRAGRTFPNAALGYPTSTVEYALQRGCTGGSGVSGSRVPEYFNGDREIERLDKAFWRFPDTVKEPLWLVYFHKRRELDCSAILGITRHQVRKRLNTGYELAFEAISTENPKRVVVSV